MLENNYYKNLPKKRMAAGAIFFNNNNEILILKPTYKDHWSIPGGVIEEDESPLSGCIREIKEEISLDIKDLKFICVDYASANNEKSESLQFIFYGGILRDEQIAKINLPMDEISDYKFINKEDALKIIGERVRKRVEASLRGLDDGLALYLENSENVGY